MMDQKTEGEIIERVIKGDRQAYSLLVEKYKNPVYNLAFRMTGSAEDADDLAQETFIRAYSKMWQFNQQKSFFTWLYTIGLNLIRNHTKKKLRESKRITAAEEFSKTQRKVNQTEGNFIAAERTAKLEDAIRKLPVDWREAVILRFYFDLSLEEVAAVCGASVSAVKMRIYRGLEKLKQMMPDSL